MEIQRCANACWRTHQDVTQSTDVMYCSTTRNHFFAWHFETTCLLDFLVTVQPSVKQLMDINFFALFSNHFFDLWGYGGDSDTRRAPPLWGTIIF